MLHSFYYFAKRIFRSHAIFIIWYEFSAILQIIFFYLYCFSYESKHFEQFCKLVLQNGDFVSICSFEKHNSAIQNKYFLCFIYLQNTFILSQNSDFYKQKNFTTKFDYNFQSKIHLFTKLSKDEFVSQKNELNSEMHAKSLNSCKILILTDKLNNLNTFTRFQ